MFRNVTEDHVAFFRSVVGDANVLCVGCDDFERYASDETENLKHLPEAVVKPTTPEQIAALLKYCNHQGVPVTTRGAGTGLSGGALPVHGGLVVSMEKFNRILEIDEANGYVITEPGVVTEALQNALKEKGWFYPPDPASRGSCFIGGNIAENSGGPKAVKYGVVKDYVVNLELVTAGGDVIWTGANTVKNVTGYNLTQIIVGSEGTLGIVTKIVLKIIPHPLHDVLMLAPFESAEKACEAVAAIFKAGFTPSALEFMERDAIEWSMRLTGEDATPLPNNVQAHLLIEVDGNDMDRLMTEAEQISNVLERFGCTDVLFADTAAQKASLWKLRRSVAEAVRAHSVYKEEDTVVPRSKLPELLHTVKSIGKKYGFKSVCYGHAGDGNLHVNIIRDNLNENEWNEKLPVAIKELFAEVVRLGGTISGEHGIGLVQKDYMPIALAPPVIELMKKIKTAFDPNGILNPGKMFN